MKLSSWGHAALVVALCAAFAQAAQPSTSRASRKAKPGDFAAELEQVELASYDSCSSCSTGDCGDGGYAGMASLGSLMERPIQIVAGAQYIYARANFSDALAFVSQDVNVNPSLTTFNQFDFNYNSSYNFYGGFYLCDCGGSVLFNYTRLTSDSDFAATATSTIDILTPYEVNATLNGQTVTGTADVSLNSYDVSFAKTIPLGCPLQCGKGCGDCCESPDACCDSCCGDGCGCGWCPAWDIQWSGGVRFANGGWTRQTTAFDTPQNNGIMLDQATSVMDFDGFGGRVGLLGRRYLGRRGLVSLYAKGDWSLLLGDVSVTTTVVEPGGDSVFRADFTNVIPVTEIELGGTVHLGARAQASVGYFWAAWHDLGMRDEYSSPLQLGHYDDANILGWDGFFARLQVMF